MQESHRSVHKKSNTYSIVHSRQSAVTVGQQHKKSCNEFKCCRLAVPQSWATSAAIYSYHTKFCFETHTETWKKSQINGISEHRVGVDTHASKKREK